MIGSCAGDAQYWSHQAARQPDVGRRRAAHAHQARGRHDGVVRLHPQRRRDLGRQARRDHRRERRRRRARAATGRTPARLHVLLSARRARPARRRLRGSAGPLHRSRVRRTRRSASRTTAASCRRRAVATSTSRPSTRAVTRSTTSPTRRTPRELGFADLEDDLGKRGFVVDVLVQRQGLRQWRAEPPRRRPRTAASRRTRSTPSERGSPTRSGPGQTHRRRRNGRRPAPTSSGRALPPAQDTRDQRVGCKRVRHT